MVDVDGASLSRICLVYVHNITPLLPSHTLTCMCTDSGVSSFCSSSVKENTRVSLSVMFEVRDQSAIGLKRL